MINFQVNMKEARLAIITDLNPVSNPGANRVAFEYAMSAQRIFETEFWTSMSSSVSDFDKDSRNIKMRTFLVNDRFLHFPQKSPVHKSIRELSSLRALISVLFWIRTFRPNIVWVHQIGNVFPYTIFLLFRLFRISTIFTLHDFGVLVPRKLFPRDLNCGESLVPLLYAQEHERLGKLLAKHSVKNRMTRFRLSIQRSILRKATLISISSLQKTIFEANGFKVDHVFANGVKKCVCPKHYVREDDSILFAGRLTGKGFEKVVDVLNSCRELHLHIAGKKELENEAVKLLTPDRFTYHGELGQNELNQLLHKVRFTAILSECFDVYPSLLLEAVVHGSYPLTYPTVGNSSILRAVSDHLVCEYATQISCSKLNHINSDIELESKLGIVAESLETFEDAFQKYRDVITASMEMR